MGKAPGAEAQVTEYNLSMHVAIGIEIDAILGIAIGEKIAWEGEVTGEGAIAIYKPGLFGGIKKEGGAVGYAYFLPGGPLQTIPTSLAQRFGRTRETCPGFRGISTIMFVGNDASDDWIPLNRGGDGGGGGGGAGWTPPGGGGCPAPWTSVLLANDERTGPGPSVPHGDLKVGNFVWTQHETTFEWGAFEVLQTEIVPDVERWNLRLDGREDTPSASWDHRVSTTRGWVRMQDLRPGDRVGDTLVLGVDYRDRGDVCRTSIADARTYLMDGLLSHNVKPVPNPDGTLD